MTVNVARAEEAGLTLGYEGRTYAFCGSGCRRSFEEEPATYGAKVDVSQAVAPNAERLVIDEGMQRWYESCSCCLSDAYPEVKAALDAARAALAAPPIGAGICAVAEGQEVTTT